MFFVVVLPGGTPTGALTGEEKDAVAAAGTEAANILSYRRASFDGDFQRALDGATGAMKADLRSQKANTQAAIEKGGFDLSARVVRSALEGRSDKSGTGASAGPAYVVLVEVDGFQSTQPGIAIPSHLKVTVQKVKDKWLVSNVESVGVQS